MWGKQLTWHCTWWNPNVMSSRLDKIGGATRIQLKEIWILLIPSFIDQNNWTQVSTKGRSWFYNLWLMRLQRRRRHGWTPYGGISSHLEVGKSCVMRVCFGGDGVYAVAKDVNSNRNNFCGGHGSFAQEGIRIEHVIGAEINWTEVRMGLSAWFRVDMRSLGFDHGLRWENTGEECCCARFSATAALRKKKERQPGRVWSIRVGRALVCGSGSKMVWV